MTRGDMAGPNTTLRPAHRRLDPAAPAQHTRGPARVAAPPAPPVTDPCATSGAAVPPRPPSCQAMGEWAVHWPGGRRGRGPRPTHTSAAGQDPTRPAQTPHRHRHRHRSECAVHGVAPAVPDHGRVRLAAGPGAGSGRMLQRASHGKTGESRGGCERWRWRAREWLAQCCCRPHPTLTLIPPDHRQSSRSRRQRADGPWIQGDTRWRGGGWAMPIRAGGVRGAMAVAGLCVGSSVGSRRGQSGHRRPRPGSGHAHVSGHSARRGEGRQRCVVLSV